MKECNSCHTSNRDSAKYCKECGSILMEANPFLNLVGKDELLEELKKFQKKCKARHHLQEVAGANIASEQIGLDCIILGDSGTGKNYLAELLKDIALSEKVISKTDLTVIDAFDVDSAMKNLDATFLANSNGIIHITNAQKIISENFSREVSSLDKLFKKMKDSKNKPIIFISGLTNGMDVFIKKNPEAIQNFEFVFSLKPFQDKDLTDLTCLQLQNTFKVSITDAARKKMSAHYKFICRKRDDNFENAHMVIKKAGDFFTNMWERGGSMIEEQDIQGPVFIPKTEQEIMNELDSFVGLHEVKETIHTIVESIKDEKRLKGNDAIVRLNDHFVFSGNPGTGKTTIARLFADILNTLEVLPSGQLVEVAGKDLVSQFVGGTAPKVKDAVAKAMGGVLFIDEAYTLSNNDNGGYGKEAIETLLPLLENRKGEFVCIIAGYTKQMNDFLRTNPGLPRRFNKTINFADYKPNELQTIYENFAKKEGLSFSSEALSKLPKFFDKLYLSKTEGFGNAGTVKNLFNDAYSRLRQRRNKMSQDDFLKSGCILEWSDIVGAEGVKNISVEDIMHELDGFVGMKSVKDAIKRIAKEIAVQKQLIEIGEAQPGLTKFNFIITGNPGTGKSTVARTFGRIFKALEVTPTDKVIEKVPKDIIGRHVNESDKIMDAAINEAMGGVLFLDEAYDIEPMDSAGQSTSSEGKKAIQTLMTRMENEAGKFVVICAGYPKEMASFLNSNPGLKRRFSHTIHIDDYSADELLQIYESAAKDKKYGFTLADENVRTKVRNMFMNMIAMKDEKFGNAGEAMKKVAETKTNINNRIANIPHDEWSTEILHTAFLEDIPYSEPEKISIDDCLAELNGLIGLNGVKSSLEKLAYTINNEIESSKAENRQPNIPLGHYLFLGNPGTGKTTVARLMGMILYSMGALPTPKVIEVGKTQLVGRYVGDTEAITTNVINSAMGGILFIDEAYQLASDQFGRNALEVLVARLENDRKKFVCIAAGYSYEMQQFISENSGFESRFPKQNRIIFEDYSAEELYKIFMLCANKDGYIIDSIAEKAIYDRLESMYINRDSKFGNGREARNLFDEVKSNAAMRLANDKQPHTAEERKTILAEDVL